MSQTKQTKRMDRCIIFSLLVITQLAWLPAAASADGPKKPVFYMKYNYGQGFVEEAGLYEEDDLAELAAATNQHTASLRIKEVFSKRLTTNFLLYFTRRDYLLESGSYHYFYFLPDISYELTDKLDVYAGFRTKWKYYDEPDSEGYSKDFINLALRTRLRFKPTRQLTLTPFLYSNFNLNENTPDKAQYYDFGLTITTKWEHITLSGKYKGQAGLPLGTGSTLTARLTNEFGMSLTWDPN